MQHKDCCKLDSLQHFKQKGEIIISESINHDVYVTCIDSKIEKHQTQSTARVSIGILSRANRPIVFPIELKDLFPSKIIHNVRMVEQSTFPATLS